jgi:hypothetical protein
MMHGPINIRLNKVILIASTSRFKSYWMQNYITGQRVHDVPKNGNTFTFKVKYSNKILMNILTLK